MEDQILADFVSRIFDPETTMMDKRFVGTSLFKYYYFYDAEFQLQFFNDPTIKFAVKSQLNDPFELTKRWDNFSTPLTRELFSEYISLYVENKVKNTNYVDDFIAEKLVNAGMASGLRQARKLAQRKFDSTKREEFISSIRTLMDFALSGVFLEVDDALKEKFEQITTTTGIFSLTEVPDNRALWSVYAQSGKGFVIEFEAQNEFFRAKSGKDQVLNRLRQVFYRDNRIADFWSNPLYLFQVKNTEYSFEKEWRMMADIKNLRKFVAATGEIIYLDAPPKGLIKSVIFGYNFDHIHIAKVVAALNNFDKNIIIKRSIINAESGCIEFEVI